jgi:poly(hydroxyalkanoate) depolymerase family esterase
LWTFAYKDANNFLGCFNWFEPEDARRGQGEALSIKQMIDKMLVDHAIDPARVFITGLSAGGAMTAVMLAAYPEVFAGGAIIGGVPYGCAENSSEAGDCMKPGKDAKPAEWGERVRRASPHTSPWPRISIWHGNKDDRVDPINAQELMEQWTHVLDIDQTPDEEDSIRGNPRKVYKDSEGRVLVESFTITGMEHGNPVDPGPGDEQCGASGPFMLDVDICSSLYIGRFWGLDERI